MTTSRWTAARAAALEHHRANNPELVDKIVTLAALADWDLHWGFGSGGEEPADYPGFVTAIAQLRDWLDDLDPLWVDEDDVVYTRDPGDDILNWDDGDYIGPETYYSVEAEMILPADLRFCI